MGPDGKRIKEITELSTNIKVSKDRESPVGRFSIHGPKEAVDKAVFLIHVCVNVFTEPKEKVGHLSLLEAVEYGLGRI